MTGTVKNGSLESVDNSSAQSKLLRWAIGLQAVYYLVTGIWPLVSMPTFLLVTGPKTDLWLVRLVSLLILVIGLTLATATRWGRPTAEIVVCSVFSCLTFICIDCVYALTGRISKVYLADAAVELIVVMLVIAGAILRWLASRCS